MHIWLKLATSFFVVVSVAAISIGVATKAGRAEAFLLALAPFAAAWAGALVGALADWKRYGRSPLAPLFKTRFGWFYGRRLWFRLALGFAFAWAAFIAVALAVSAAASATDEIRSFLSPKGVLVLLLFLAVFALEGALIGGILDVVLYARRKGKKGE